MFKTNKDLYKSKMSKAKKIENYIKGGISSTTYNIPGSKPFTLKGEVNAKAIIETQLVPQKFPTETMAGKVNLEKVRDIRRALRRRYATRRNIAKIFQSWDRGKKGHVSIDDCMQMINNMGHKINFNEARVLLASADADQDNKLKLDEFLGMIYSNSDRLDMDIEKITQLQPG